jgi:hypothetical protein
VGGIAGSVIVIDVGVNKDIGDFLLGGFEEAEHGGAPGTFGLAGEGVGIGHGFSKFVVLDKKGKVGAVVATTGSNVNSRGDRGVIKDVNIACKRSLVSRSRMEKSESRSLRPGKEMTNFVFARGSPDPSGHIETWSARSLSRSSRPDLRCFRCTL